LFAGAGYVGGLQLEDSYTFMLRVSTGSIFDGDLICKCGLCPNTPIP